MNERQALDRQPPAARTRTTYARFVKPVLDRTLGLVGALVTLPLLLVLVIAAWNSFGWPPIYRAAHVGRTGKRFNLYRINTRIDYETDLRGPRRRLSHWLRATSLDELPQLWNVALGHMSLVGPRPLHPMVAIELDELGELRSQAKPGLTGRWQVEARGDGRGLDDAVEVDIAYLAEMSLLTDLKILARTPLALIRARERT
jgi:lipopolysaccharide/colanic/teichoic acid biosynthesis glycosyltransferase